MPHVIRTRQFEVDLTNILEYIDEFSPTAATRFATEVDRMVQLIGQIPGIGRTREELGFGIRSKVIQSYILIYQIRDEDIFLLRVIHGRRDIPRLFQDDG